MSVGVGFIFSFLFSLERQPVAWYHRIQGEPSHRSQPNLELPHRYAQKFVSMVMTHSTKLTVKSSYQQSGVGL